MEYVSKSGDRFHIVEYKSSVEVKIRFTETGYEYFTEMSKIRKGSVKDKLKPSVLGVGFIGDGPHRSKIDRVQTKEYSLWQGVIDRCYNEVVHAKYPHYADCIVDPQWHNFQEFAEWCQWQEGFNNVNKAWTLDKDLLFKNNKIYSPITCVFLPNEINCSLNFKRSGNYCGVSYHKDTGKFVAQIRCGEISKHIGLFTREIDAFIAYKSEKEAQIKSLAERYKEFLDSRAYFGLMNWEVIDRE